MRTLCKRFVSPNHCAKCQGLIFFGFWSIFLIQIDRLCQQFECFTLLLMNWLPLLSRRAGGGFGIDDGWRESSRLLDSNAVFTSKHAADRTIVWKAVVWSFPGKDADKDSSGLISAKELYKAIIQGEARENDETFNITNGVQKCWFWNRYLSMGPTG